MKNKKEINMNCENLLEQWLEFRSDILAEVSEEDKEYLHGLKTTGLITDIIENIPVEKRELAKEKINFLLDVAYEEGGYFNDKYYKKRIF